MYVCVSNVFAKHERKMFAPSISHLEHRSSSPRSRWEQYWGLCNLLDDPMYHLFWCCLDDSQEHVRGMIPLFVVFGKKKTIHGNFRGHVMCRGMFRYLLYCSPPFVPRSGSPDSACVQHVNPWTFQSVTQYWANPWGVLSNVSWNSIKSFKKLRGIKRHISLIFHGFFHGHFGGFPWQFP